MERFVVLFIGLWGLCLQVLCSDVNITSTNYDDYSLVNLVPATARQLAALQQLQDPEHEVEVLKASRALNDSADLLVPASRKAFLARFASEHGLEFRVKQDNYGRTFDDIERMPRRRTMRFNIYGYNSYQAIQEYLETLAERHSNLVTLQHVGHSFQGRPMKLVRISANPDAGNPVIFVDAGIHAREWVAPAMATYLIHRLVNDPAAAEMADVDWYILPVVNPDGYEFTRSSKSNRLWRKTRSNTKSYNCYGVDGNRNYGYRWGVSGVSNDPCDKETYAGPQPFSEIETQIVRNALLTNKDRIKLYVSLHAYGQYLVYPWGYTADYLPKEWRKLDTLARKVSNAVERAGGKPFRVMSAGKWYPAAGGSDDYAFGAVGVPYSYTMELTDGYEFQFPESQLRIVFPQFYEGFRAFARQIGSEFKTL